MLLPLGTAAYERFDSTLDRFKPRGYTPIAAALREARGAFVGKENDINRIILVTDGVETCGRNPVAEARALKQSGIAATPPATLRAVEPGRIGYRLAQLRFDQRPVETLVVAAPAGRRRIYQRPGRVPAASGTETAQRGKNRPDRFPVTTDVVGFDVAKPREAARLRAIAKAAGGVYTDARSARALRNYFEQAIDAYSDAAKSKVCVLGDRAKQAHCMNVAHSDALNYMNRASPGQTEARAKEISRLASKFERRTACGATHFRTPRCNRPIASSARWRSLDTDTKS